MEIAVGWRAEHVDRRGLGSLDRRRSEARTLPCEYGVRDRLRADCADGSGLRALCGGPGGTGFAKSLNDNRSLAVTPRDAFEQLRTEVAPGEREDCYSSIACTGSHLLNERRITTRRQERRDILVVPLPLVVKVGQRVDLREDSPRKLTSRPFNVKPKRLRAGASASEHRGVHDDSITAPRVDQDRPLLHARKVRSGAIPCDFDLAMQSIDITAQSDHPVRELVELVLADVPKAPTRRLLFFAFSR